MFFHIGKKIKAIAVGFCAIGLLAICVSVLMLISASIDLLPNKDALISVGVYFAIAGVAFLLISFFAYGFGELVENSRIIADQLMRQHMEQDGKWVEIDKPDVSAERGPRRKKEAPVSEPEAPQPVKKSDTWQCPECGMIHPAIRPVCWECGAARPEEE